METSFTKTTAQTLSNPTPFWTAPMNRFVELYNGGTQTTPSINWKEDKNTYVVEMAAPGLKKEDFNVNVEGNLLTVHSNKETDADNYHHREYSYTCFTRTVTLPAYAESKGIAAKYTDGILCLTIPKKPEAPKASQKIRVD